MAREGLMDDCGYNFDVDEDSYNSGFKDGFLTAVDEFAELLLSKLDVEGRDWYCARKINEVAEELKEE